MTRQLAAARGAGGFTLLELVITVAIVAILASVAMPLNELVVQRAKEQDLRRALQDMRRRIGLSPPARGPGRGRRRPEIA